MSSPMNQRFVLASRPVGAPTAENFRLEEVNIPALSKNDVLIENHHLSIDPYMRGRMSDAKSYAEPVAIDGLMVGATVGKVLESQHADYQAGDWVLAYKGWETHSVVNGDTLIKLNPDLAPVSYALGILGMPGFTAYMGLLDIGQPKEDDTLVVAAATGPVGATVAQIGKLKGCRVVAIAGGEEKCQYARENLNVDACIDHKADNFAEQLAEACPQGIDIYFENVGGKVFDGVMPLLNTGARIPVCGLVSQYNNTALPDGPDRLSQLMGTILVKRLTIKGFIIFDDYAHRYPEFAHDMAKWVGEGQIHYREHAVDGFEQAPQALIDVLEGRNFGKMVVNIK